MSDVVIRAENLGKKYTIGHSVQQERYTALRDVIARNLATAIRNAKDLAGGRPIIEGDELEEFWALRDVCFEVRRGQAIGVIGRNGAGKSTLLKILSRIIEPSAGRVSIEGRVASLLEVGTGFHPELTGRENIFLNGAILGMSRGEIKRKFDAIVDFAEVAKFLDTPVKRYSSGMYVRLAFAVAAHLEMDVLIVDEVLAVGDFEFQRRCVAKLEDVAGQSGRTILFVSHNLAFVSNLCERVILLNGGNVQFAGPTEEGLRIYTARGQDSEQKMAPLISSNPSRPSWARPLISGSRIIGSACETIGSVSMGERIAIEVTFESGETPLRRPVLGIVINSVAKGVVTGVNTRMTGPHPEGSFRGGKIVCELGNLPLLHGEYTIDIWLGDGRDDLDTLEGLLRLVVHEADVYRTGVLPFSNMGTIYLQPKWEFCLTE